MANDTWPRYVVKNAGRHSDPTGSHALPLHAVVIRTAQGWLTLCNRVLERRQGWRETTLDAVSEPRAVCELCATVLAVGGGNGQLRTTEPR